MPVLSSGLVAWGWSGASADRVAGRSFNHECDAKVYRMKTASLRDLRYRFKKVEHLLRQGEEVQITKRRHVIATDKKALLFEPRIPNATTVAAKNGAKAGTLEKVALDDLKAALDARHCQRIEARPQNGIERVALGKTDNRS
jgi:hypothetical protein